LIPMPAGVEIRSGAFSIDRRTVLSQPRDQRAAKVARYFAELLRRTRGFDLPLAGSSSGHAAPAINFEIRLGMEGVSPEGYTIEVSPENVEVAASDPRGLLYGAVTLWQLCTTNRGAEIAIPALRIQDSPRFAWRGLMLDSARHYQSPEFILNLIN